MGAQKSNSLITQGAAANPQFQPNSEVTQSDDGLLTATGEFVVDLGLESLIPDVGAVHPYDPRLICTGRRIIYGTQKSRGACSFMGLISDPTPYVYQWPGASGQDPIETHPDFTDFGTAGNGAKFNSNGGFIEFADSSNRKFGVRSYIVPNPTVYRSYWTYKKPDVKREGTIVNSIPKLVKPPQVKNWLLIGMPYRTIGTGLLYQVTEQYLGSGPDGWDPDIYNG